MKYNDPQFAHIPEGMVRDSLDRLITHKDSRKKRLIVREYHDTGEFSSIIAIDGSLWYKYTFDESGTQKTREYEGFCGHRIAEHGYTLFWDKEKDLFSAGCRISLTREKALNHWDRRDREDKRAKIFTEAILKTMRNSDDNS